MRPRQEITRQEARVLGAVKAKPLMDRSTETLD
jgi:hypothetical protein